MAILVLVNILCILIVYKSPLITVRERAIRTLLSSDVFVLLRFASYVEQRNREFDGWFFFV
jgi:hypothetical protein